MTTAWNRVAGSKTANPLPAWLAAMAAKPRNTLMAVSGTNVPGTTNAAWINASIPPHMGVNSISPSFGNGADVMGGYASGTWLPVNGPYGIMVYGCGGHDVIQNQLLGLDLNPATASFFWFQDILYQTADVNGANLFYDPGFAAANSVPSQRIVNMSNQDAFAGVWDRVFPVCTSTGWVFPRKMTTGQMGNNAPHGFRFSNPCYVPASITGADPLLIVGGPRPQGPFSLSEYPGGITPAEWFNASYVHASGRRVFPIHALNLRTRVWSVIGNFPDLTGAGLFQGITWGVDPTTRRAYAGCDSGAGGPAYCYVDFSGGMGAITVSSLFQPSVTGSHGRYSNCSGAITARHPTQKLLYYYPDSGGTGKSLFFHDVVGNSALSVDLTSRGLDLTFGNEKLGTDYDPRGNRLFFVQPISVGDPSLGYKYFWATVPTGDPTVAANYTVTSQTVSIDPSVTTSTSANLIAEFYGKTRLIWIEALGTYLCLIPFARGPMLGFLLS